MASWEVVSPHLSQGSDQPKAQPKALGVFWDIENCNVPNGKSAIAVCERIRRQSFFRGHREIQFAVVCDVTREHRGVLEDLDKAQVDILHVGSNRKNAADDKLKQLMRRFADLHRDGSRIVLISGDMDFAADIADFKRRMFLSVILLHSPNASESLINAASEAHNYQGLLATVPSRPEVVVGHGEEATLLVSNLPSVTDCPEEEIRRELSEVARRCSGSLKSLNCTNGSAVLRFPTLDQAGNFKQKFIHHKIKNRSINVHWGPRNRGKSPHQRPRCKSFSQSPGPVAIRPRTYSEGERKTSSEEAGPTALSSSQDSTGGDMVEGRMESLNLGDRRGGRARQASESSLTAEPSSPEDDLVAGRRVIPRPSKGRARLKLKSRKKSEATPEFLARGERWRGLARQAEALLLVEPDYCLETVVLRQRLPGAKDLAVAELQEGLKERVEVRPALCLLPLARVQGELERRLPSLLAAAPGQAVPLHSLAASYRTAHGTCLTRLMELHHLPSLPLLLAPCPHLTVLTVSGTPHLARLSSPLVSTHLRRVTDLLHGLGGAAALTDLERCWRERWQEGGGSQVGALARRPELEVAAGRASLAPALRDGYRLAELLTSMGGSAPLAALASRHGPEVGAALANLDSLGLLVRRRGGAVMLEELHQQLEAEGGGGAPDLVAGTPGAPAVRSVRPEQQFRMRPSLAGPVWREASEEPRRRVSGSPQRSSTPGEIITIEDSEGEGGGPSSGGRGAGPESGSRGRRRSKIAANFSGSEH